MDILSLEDSKIHIYKCSAKLQQFLLDTIISLIANNRFIPNFYIIVYNFLFKQYNNKGTGNFLMYNN